MKISTKSLRTIVSIARVGTSLLVASGVGTIAGAAIAQVPVNPSGLDKVAVKFGAYALQAVAVKHATSTMDEGFGALFGAIDAIDQVMVLIKEDSDEFEGDPEIKE